MLPGCCVEVDAQSVRWLRARVDSDGDEPSECLGRRRPSARLPLLPLLGKPAPRPLVDMQVGKRCLPRLGLAAGFVETPAVLNRLQQQTSVVTLGDAFRPATTPSVAPVPSCRRWAGGRLENPKPIAEADRVSRVPNRSDPRFRCASPHAPSAQSSSPSLAVSQGQRDPTRSNKLSSTWRIRSGSSHQRTDRDRHHTVNLGSTVWWTRGCCDAPISRRRLWRPVDLSLDDAQQHA